MRTRTLMIETMKKIRRKLHLSIKIKTALIVSVFSFSLMAAALIVYNHNVMENLRAASRNMLSYAENYYSIYGVAKPDSYLKMVEDSFGDGTNACFHNYFIVVEGDAPWFYNPYRSTIDEIFIDWVMETAPGMDKGVMYHKILDGRAYYLKKTDMYFRNADSSLEPKTTVVLFCDVTAEYNVVYRSSLVATILGVILGFIGAYCGYRYGTIIEDVNSAQRNFFSTMSHQLKTPASIITFSLAGYKKGVVSLEDHLKTTESELAKLDRLTNQIILLSKAETRTLELRPADYSLNDFAQDCLMPFEGAFMSAGKKFYYRYKGDCIINVDEDKFFRAVENVLQNAIDYSKTEIVMTCEDGYLSIWNDCEDGAIDASVCFDRFYMGSTGSIGVGLALAKELTELHGYSISAYNKDGGFCVLFDFTIKSII